MQTAAPITVVVTQNIPVSVEKLFDAWITPDMIGKFMFGPAVRDEVILHLHVDAKVGGKFSFVVKRQGETLNHIGEYLAVNRPKRLAFTWGIEGQSQGSKVNVVLSPAKSGTDLILSHEIPAEWASYADRTKRGWRTMVDALLRALS